MTDIPPAVIEVGPIATRIPEIAARVATNVHAATTDAWIENAVDAAVLYVISWTGRAAVGLPDDALTVAGLVGFAERIYLDAYSPNGAQVAVADASFAPMFQPEHLFKHWSHYFQRLEIAWGIA